MLTKMMAGVTFCVLLGSASGQVVDQNKMTGSGGNAAQMSKDRLFLHGASEGGLAEVELGKLAVQKSGNAEVKAFAQMMVDDHTKMNASLKPISESIQAAPAKKMGKQDQAEFAKLSALSGPEFDKEYLGYMVKDHKKDLRDFNDELAGTENTELKNAVANGQQMISTHLAAAQKLAAANGAA